MGRGISCYRRGERAASCDRVVQSERVLVGRDNMRESFRKRLPGCVAVVSKSWMDAHGTNRCTGRLD